MDQRFYDRVAEHVAVLLLDAWTDLAPALAGALRGLDASAGPVLDIGAGSGVGTAVLASALPGAAIVAVEPDRALRTALLARCVEDDALRHRVTVVDDDVLAAELPHRLGGVVAMNVLGHLDPPGRRILWGRLAERLDPGGWVVLNLQPPFAVVAVPAVQMAEVAIGERLYRGLAQAEPSATREEAITWRMTYRVEQGGLVVSETTASDEWTVVAPESLAVELAEEGFALHLLDPERHLYRLERLEVPRG